MGLAGVRGDVDKVSQSLRLFSDTLEEWLECQKKWLYLENIFMAPDIQRQLPNETKMFATVDRQFKSILRITRDRPAALQVSQSQATVMNCILRVSVHVHAARCFGAHSIYAMQVACTSFSQGRLCQPSFQKHNSPYAMQLSNPTRSEGDAVPALFISLSLTSYCP